MAFHSSDPTSPPRPPRPSPFRPAFATIINNIRRDHNLDLRQLDPDGDNALNKARWLYNNHQYDILQRYIIDLRKPNVCDAPNIDRIFNNYLAAGVREAERAETANGNRLSKSFSDFPNHAMQKDPPPPPSPTEPSASFATETSILPIDTSDTEDDKHPDADRLLFLSPPKIEEQKHQEDYRFCNLPNSHFWVAPMSEDTVPNLIHAPYGVRYECTRVAVAYGISWKSFQTLTSSQWDTYPGLRLALADIVKSSVGAKALPSAMSNDVWKSSMDAGHTENARFQATARLSYSHSGPSATFAFKLLPLQPVPACATRRLHRKFGARRFLTVKVSDASFGPTYLQRLREWAIQPDKPLLGNTWTVFKMRHSTRSNRRHRENVEVKPEDLNVYEFLFFATSGPGLKPISIVDLLHWSINIRHPDVMNMSFAKAYSRIDLNLTPTQATVLFEPSQIVNVPDALADGTPEDQDFENGDPRWRNVSVYDADNPEVMDDGCARMSFGAGQMVCEMLDLKDHPPSAFQGRLGGAKGMWMVDNVVDGRVWIEVTPSQLKYARHKRMDKHRCTLDVMGWTKPAAMSKVYRDFIPIIEAGGVPRCKLELHIKESLDFEDDTLKLALDDSARLVKWVDERFPRSSGDAVALSWPHAFADQLRLQLESGFTVHQNIYAMTCLERSAQTLYERCCAELSLASKYSTFLYGVADPIGCLDSGEVHVCFSNSVHRPGQGPGPVLVNIQALVGRLPAIRASDLQKVRLVFKAELAHLVDVAVFPRKGIHPLAKKLQGGDYDGDHFVIIWDPRLTEDFENSPPPPLAQEPGLLHKYGIQKDSRTTIDVLKDGGVMVWLRENFALQMKENQLGRASNDHSRLAYFSNTLESDALNALADLHDLLVDTEKNGYIFDGGAYTNFENKFLRADETVPGEMFRKDTHKQEYKTLKTTSHAESPGLFSRIASASGHPPACNVIDYLIFHVAGPIGHQKYTAAIESVRSREPGGRDMEVEHAYLTICSVYGEDKDDDLRRTVQGLSEGMRHILQLWQPAHAKCIEDDLSSKAKFAEMRSLCTESFKNLQPFAPNHPLVRDWRLPLAPNGITKWDFLKVSCLFHCAATDKRMRKPMSVIFDIAGRMICVVKSLASRHGLPAVLVPSIARYRKMQRIAALAETELAGFEERASFAVEQGADHFPNVEAAPPNADPEQLADAPPGEDDYHDAQETQPGAYGEDIFTSSVSWPLSIPLRPSQHAEVFSSFTGADDHF